MKFDHWFNYWIEALGLGSFMVSAGVCATLLYSPNFPIMRWLPNPVHRDILMGVVMGLTAIAIIYSPWGKRSGAHINPAVTLTFYTLNKIEARDAIAYIIAQFMGGLVGVWLVVLALGESFIQRPVSYVVTLPSAGIVPAFITESILSFTLMLMVLITSNKPSLSRFTGIFSGILLSFFIPLAAPISGMSINPARTIASALPAQLWTHLWIYLIAPPLAMLLASKLYLAVFQRPTRELCCKLYPNHDQPCISHRCCQHCSTASSVLDTPIISIH